MDNQLVKKTFTLDNRIGFDCWVVKIDNEFWFKAHDIAIFLAYQDPSQAIRKNVPIEIRKQWREFEDQTEPSYLQIGTLILCL
jgi:prophage antirepressor-like protein